MSLPPAGRRDLRSLRQGAPARPAVAGAVAGNFAVAPGLRRQPSTRHTAPMNSPLFVATWYTLATAIVASVGALMGKRALTHTLTRLYPGCAAYLGYINDQAAGADCCMRWKRSTCCAVDGRSRS